MGNININIRPMNKGMVTDVPVNLVPSGAFLNLEGFMVKDGRLRLRPRFVNANTYDSYDPTTYGSAVGIAQVTVSSSVIENYLVTEESVFEDTGEEYELKTITRAIDGAVTDPFTYNKRVGIQWTAGRDDNGYAIWFSDGSNPLVKYEETSGTWTDVLASFTSPRSVLYHDSRLWVAAPTADQGSMIRWSNLNDSDTFADTSYIYFPERVRPITRIMTLGQYIVVYFPDAVYVGQPSGDPYLPYFFTVIDSEALGLIGPNAVTSWRNGHIFIAQNGIFWIQPDLQLTQVPCPVWSEFRGLLTRTDKFTIMSAGEDADLHFGVPSETKDLDKIIHFNPAENAWAVWDVEGDSLTLNRPLVSFVWSDDDDYFILPDGVTRVATWGGFEAAGVTMWNDLKRLINPSSLAVLRNGKTYTVSDDHTDDAWGTAGTSFTIETGDYDFEEADMVKTFHKLRIRTDCADATGHNVLLEWSENSGRTWRTIGTTTILNTDESSINFHATGAEVRFRLSGQANVAPYNWNDLTFRVRGRGLETT